MREITIAAVQMDVVPRDWELNLEKALFLIGKAAARGAQIVCLPELFLTGFDYDYMRGFSKAACVKSAIADEARSRGIYIVAGTLPEERRGYVYNSALLFKRTGNIQGRYRKTHLFPVMDEDKFFTPGEELPVFSTPLGRIGIIICYDLRFPELARKLALCGAEMVFVPAEFPCARQAHWKALLRARAVENQFFVIGVNRTGRDLENSFCGASCIIDPWGEVVADAAADEDGIALARVDLEYIYHTRERIPCFYNRRVDLY